MHRPRCATAGAIAAKTPAGPNAMGCAIPSCRACGAMAPANGGLLECWMGKGVNVKRESMLKPATGIDAEGFAAPD
jgi:hypothetical protein